MYMHTYIDFPAAWDVCHNPSGARSGSTQLNNAAKYLFNVYNSSVFGDSLPKTLSQVLEVVLV